MVVRRIREHVATHNWFAVCIDLAIVVAGVFIATQATIWNDGRIVREQSQSYRARLIDELDFNSRQYRQQIAYYKQVREHGLATLKSLESPADRSDRNFLVDAYQTTQIDTALAKTFTYDELVSAGLVNRLGSTDVQMAVSDYYLTVAAINRSLEETLPYRTIMRALMPYSAQTQIRNQCGDIAVSYKRRIIGYRLPNECNVHLNGETVTAAVTHIRKQPRIVDDLTRYLASLDEKVGALEGTLIQTEALIATLHVAPREDVDPGAS